MLCLNVACSYSKWKFTSWPIASFRYVQVWGCSRAWGEQGLGVAVLREGFGRALPRSPSPGYSTTNAAFIYVLYLSAGS